MSPSETERRVIAALEPGLPLVPRPYAEVARRAGLDEAEVLRTLRRLVDGGLVHRFGIVVHHHALGYRANAMVVWDVPDDRVAALGRRFAAFDFVTLCYRRPRRPPVWPYNLYCMIHGRRRAEVRAQVAELARACDAEAYPHEVLFSTRRFKQRGAVRGAAPREAAE